MFPTLPSAAQSGRVGRAASLLAAVSAAATLCAACGSSSASSGTTQAAAAASTTSTTAQSTAATITNCGVKVHVASPPKHAISLNQGATELMLTLGLQKRMAGTAYLDDSVLPSLKKAYDSVPVLSKEYPSAEKFLAARPDFAIASYASAFAAKGGVGTRSSLAKLGVTTYIMPDGCPNAGSSSTSWTFADDFSEIRQIGALFGVQNRAAQVITSQKAALRSAAAGMPGKGLRILWWDSEDKAPFIGACCGGPALIMKAVGATNVFGHVKGDWQNINWESALKTDPNVIVLVNASWDTLKSKENYIAHDPALQALPAVRHKRFVVIPFSDSTPGVRNVDAVEKLAAGLRALHLNR
jgi:iron complex transport system substrate-binding protein